jgi:hypothetical protein
MTNVMHKFLSMYLFLTLHVSSTSCSSSGETNCVNTTSGSCRWPCRVEPSGRVPNGTASGVTKDSHSLLAIKRLGGRTPPQTKGPVENFSRVHIESQSIRPIEKYILSTPQIETARTSNQNDNKQYTLHSIGRLGVHSQPARDTATNTEWQLPEVVLTQFVSPDDEHAVLETCRELDKSKYIERNLCVTLVIYQESLHDARSTKCKIFLLCRSI